MSLLCAPKKSFTAIRVGGGTLHADFQGMSAIIPFRSRLQADSIAPPNPGLVGSERRTHPHIVRTPDESPNNAVMACLTASDSDHRELLRKARVAAREHGGEFYATLIDSPKTRFGKAQIRTLIDDAILASCFGAKIVWLDSSDVVGALLQFARQSNVGRIFINRTRPAPFSGLFRRAVYADLLIRGEGFRIDVVGFEPRN
jgi:K+-sensing histidine kinase KdpD